MSAPAMTNALEGLDVDRFWERGYAILHGVYTPEEIGALREAAYASKGYGGDLLANPRLRSVLTDGRMVAVARKLLGTDELIYTGDSSFTINGTQKGWHKDNTDRIDPEAPDWASQYTQLRFGIYCQDHAEHTGGLNLRIGSHEIRNTSEGEVLYVKTTPGDLAVWSMRITHSGNGMLLKDPEAPYPLPNEHDRFAPEDVTDADGDRIAVFAHIGADDSHGKRYADYTKTRTYLVNAWRKRPYDDAARAAAAEAGLTLRDLPAEVMDDSNAGLSELWAPFPYAGQKLKPAAPGTAPAVASAAPAAPQPVAEKTGSSAAVDTAKATLRRAAKAARGGARGVRDGWRAGRQ
ncbi:MAG: hypothetical protein L0H96_06560 [Humibacillus sp.]|nr:hypothetical protein [Humibacillus sp.]MDN5776555.1 hypothetical protein [Humibacillus sp.]